MPWKLPEFMDWGGNGWLGAHKWSFGWWTGPDGDLICVIPEARTAVQAEIALSPVCPNRCLAVLCFHLKRLMLWWHNNMTWQV